MRAIILRPGEAIPDVEMERIVITEDVKQEGQRLRKGHLLTADDMAFLARPLD